MHRYNLVAVSGYYRPLATYRERGLGRPATLILGYRKEDRQQKKLNVRFRYTQTGRGFGGRQPRTTSAPLRDLIHLTFCLPSQVPTVRFHSMQEDG